MTASLPCDINIGCIRQQNLRRAINIEVYQRRILQSNIGKTKKIQSPTLNLDVRKYDAEVANSKAYAVKESLGEARQCDIYRT